MGRTINMVWSRCVRCIFSISVFDWLWTALLYPFSSFELEQFTMTVHFCHLNTDFRVYGFLSVACGRPQMMVWINIRLLGISLGIMSGWLVHTDSRFPKPSLFHKTKMCKIFSDSCVVRAHRMALGFALCLHELVKWRQNVIFLFTWRQIMYFTRKGFAAVLEV